MKVKELTREEAIDEYRKMWRWIAEETIKQQRIVYKEEYMKKYFPDDKINLDCFCCEYDKQKSSQACSHCPIDWGSECGRLQCIDKYHEDDFENLFYLWEFTSDWKEAARLAKQIAELPERQV